MMFKNDQPVTLNIINSTRKQNISEGMRRLLTTTAFGADFPLDIVAVQYKRINLG